MHVQGLSETTTEDCLRFYLEKFSDVEVEEVCFGSKNNALATFEAEPGNYVNKVMRGRCREKGLTQSTLTEYSSLHPLNFIFIA